MVRLSKLAVSGLNVRIVDPDLRDYVGLFGAIMRTRRSAQVRGTDHLLMTSFGPIASATGAIRFGGAIGKYTDIPEDSDWLDTQSLTVADDDKMDSIIIPDTLKPNYQAFLFALFPEDHIIAFESYSLSKSLSAKSVEKWLKLVTAQPAITSQFGRIEVNVVPDYDILETIISSETLRQINILIEMPNPDDYNLDVFQNAEERLRSLNAKTEELTYTAQLSEFLTLDDKTKELAKVAAENGQVKARVKNGNVITPLSTTSHPLEVTDAYDRDVVATEAFFRSLAVRMLSLIRRNRRGTPV
jgi:hypothetical protein